MLTELIFTGSELLQGRTFNSHAQYLGQWLSGHNFEVGFNVTVGDHEDKLEMVFRQALERSDLILVTGGLGPTTDDLTKETIARALSLPMHLNQEALSSIKRFFDMRNMTMPNSNLRQAYMPQGATVLPNRKGTAPGVLIEKGKKIIALLPGPPLELTEMVEETLTPLLLQKVAFDTTTKFKVIKVTGIAESLVQDKLLDLGGQGNPGITYLASPGQVLIRVTGRDADEKMAEKLVKGLTDKVTARLNEYIFGYDEDNIEEIVGRHLLENGMTISTAESCTGGLIAARLIGIPGSSAYVAGGVIAYSNELKINILGVASDIIADHGAVSSNTAEAMADGVRRLTSADLGLSVTGIAGPEGGTATKPVGLVYIALSTPAGTIYRKYNFPGNRLAVRNATVNAALNMVKLYLNEATTIP